MSADKGLSVEQVREIAIYVALRLPERIPLGGDRNEAAKTIERLLNAALNAQAGAAPPVNRNEILEEAAQACENEKRCYADNHRAHNELCHDQDAAAIRALAEELRSFL